MSNFPVFCRTDPFFGVAYSNVQVYSYEEWLVGSRVYILPVAHDEDGGSLLLSFQLCICKVEDLCNWIYVVILILLQ
jgi:hypothetical protein